MRFTACSALLCTLFLVPCEGRAMPNDRNFPLTSSEVACTELKLARAQRRMASVGSGQIAFTLGILALWPRAGGGGTYSGIARQRDFDSWQDFLEGVEHFDEADLAFELLFTKNESVLDPRAPRASQATLVRRAPGSNLVLDHTVDNPSGGEGGCCMSADRDPFVCAIDLTCPQILNFDLSAVPRDSVKPLMPLVINNAAAATPNFTGLPAELLAAASSTGPGIAADALDEPCGGTITAFDAHVFEILARTLAPSDCYLADLGGAACGVVGFNVALFRGTDPHAFRANIYDVQYLCDPSGNCYSTTGPLELEFHVNWDGEGHLTTGDVTVLPECRRGETTDCSGPFSENFVGIFVLPPIFPGHGEEEPAAFRRAPYLAVTPNRTHQILKATINWSALLGNSGLNSP
jgi:hypothetical protein